MIFSHKFIVVYPLTLSSQSMKSWSLGRRLDIEVLSSVICRNLSSFRESKKGYCLTKMFCRSVNACLRPIQENCLPNKLLIQGERKVAQGRALCRYHLRTPPTARDVPERGRVVKLICAFRPFRPSSFDYGISQNKFITKL
jgi:hypothetical protein